MRADSDEYVGRVVAKKYRVEELIGEGGMGKVYRARQMALEKQVVLKVLRHSLLSDERTVQRFQREARAASRLNHPNSISILDFGQVEDGALFIAMEFVPGKDLHYVLSKEWPLPESRVIRIVSQVLSALSDAHGAGVIHRDLKPENIMVEQRRGEPDFVKVLDFGIAKITDANGDEGPALTRAGFVCGTPEYMSPEQARGANIDQRSDLYAVGVILYQLLTGALPFEADSAVGFATKHLSEEPMSPTKRRPDARISAGMERLILRALAKDPSQRPQTAEVFRGELLALDRDRRANGAGARRSGGAVAAGTARLASTPLDQQETRLAQGGFSKGGVHEEPTVLRNLPAPSVLDLPTDPRVLPMKLATSPSAETSSAPAHSSPSRLLATIKVATAILVAVSLGLGGYFLYSAYLTSRASEPYVPPRNAPVQIGTKLPGAEGPLYERTVEAGDRDPTKAQALMREADEAFRRGDDSLAAARYEAAFSKDPSPDLSLRLGELYYQLNDRELARGWWSRHLRDRSDSRARRYIFQALPELQK